MKNFSWYWISPNGMRSKGRMGVIPSSLFSNDSAQEVHHIWFVLAFRTISFLVVASFTLLSFVGVAITKLKKKTHVYLSVYIKTIVRYKMLKLNKT